MYTPFLVTGCPRRKRAIILPLFVANGITGVRDMGGDLDMLKQWRSAIASQKLFGPTNHYRWPHARWHYASIPPALVLVRRCCQWPARFLFYDLVKSGVDFIKIHAIPRRLLRRR